MRLSLPPALCALLLLVGCAAGPRPAASPASRAGAEAGPALEPALTALAAPCPGAEPGSLLHLTVLATNDLHGALESKVYPWSDGRPVGGAATLAGYMARERAANPDGTLLVDGGDLMQGTPISNLVQGESVIDVMNRMAYDAAAVGNHEFDWGIETLERRRSQARFPLLAANVIREDGARPDWAVPGALVRRKGLSIGFIGLTTRSTPTTTLPSHVADLRFEDLAEAADRTAAELRRAGADLIIVLAHAGGFFDPDSGGFSGEIVDAMRRMSTPVDLVVSGHTHTLLNGFVNGVPLVQARSSGTALAVVQLWVEARTRRVACSDARVVTTYADRVRPDPRVAAIVDGYGRRMAAVTERTVARAAEPLTGDRQRESRLGDLIADAQRAATGSQIALTNSGGIRSDIDAGPITWREAFEVQPFSNLLYRLELDGRTLREALENGVDGHHGLVQVSGIRFAVDPAAPPGSRVRDLRLEDGRTVELDSTYTVTTNNFMAQGGDDYTMLRDAPAVENTGIVDLDAFLDHLRALPQPIQYEVQGRIRFVGGDVGDARDR
jgi:5'-nucleotidase